MSEYFDEKSPFVRLRDLYLILLLNLILLTAEMVVAVLLFEAYVVGLF